MATNEVEIIPAFLKGPGPSRPIQASHFRIAIIHARWNSTVVNALVQGSVRTLLAAGVDKDNIICQSVPGSFELPFAVQQLYNGSRSGPVTDGATEIKSASTDQGLPQGELSGTESRLRKYDRAKPFDAIIAIGALIKGETMHFEYIAAATSQALMDLQMKLGVPVIFGLLTVLSERQALERAGLVLNSHCHGEDWGAAALEMAAANREWQRGLSCANCLN